MALQLTGALHRLGIGAQFTPGDRSLKAQLKAANRLDAAFAVILGEDEIKAGLATVRDLSDSSQTTVGLEQLPGWLKERLA